MSGNTQPGTVDELTTLYRETIVRHAVEPVGFEANIEPTHSKELYNPLCGDRIEVLLQIEDNEIEALAFRGEACAICMASASLLCQLEAGRSVEEFATDREWLASALGGETGDADIEPLLPLIGVRAYPSRVKCAMLPWDAAVDAVGES